MNCLAIISKNSAHTSTRLCYLTAHPVFKMACFLAIFVRELKFKYTLDFICISLAATQLTGQTQLPPCQKQGVWGPPWGEESQALRAWPREKPCGCAGVRLPDGLCFLLWALPQPLPRLGKGAPAPPTAGEGGTLPWNSRKAQGQVLTFWWEVLALLHSDPRPVTEPSQTSFPLLSPSWWPQRDRLRLERTCFCKSTALLKQRHHSRESIHKYLPRTYLVWGNILSLNWPSWSGEIR